MDDKSKELCPRLIDFLVIVGRKPDSKLQKAPPIGAHVHPSDVPPLRRRTGFVGVANPEILRRYPTDNHKDFTLPTDVTYFCQPEGCITVADNYKHSRKGHETTSFIYMLTEKDTSKIRYGITLNFFVHFDAKPTHTTTSGNPTKRKPTASLTSLCLISHHPFLSTFAEILRLLAQLIDACNMRCNFDDSLPRDSLWMVLTGHWTGPIPQNVMQEVKQIETWILLLLSSPVPVPGKTKLVLEILPEEVMKMQEFALPDHTRFSMMDFPLHLPLELLNVDTVITLLTAVMLEHKVILQSRNYNAVSMCVMSLVALLYPLEYMFPVIPLLPTFLQNAEQLLLAPTPFIIGLPASFFLCKGIKLPDDVMLVDLDTNEVTIPPGLEISELPEPERSNLKQDFLAALGKTVSTAELNESHTNGSFEASYQMDPDEIDVACRIAMINFFDSPNVFANFSEHTRTLRLYPRPVVALQTESFLRSRPYLSQFIQDLCRTQSVEYFAEECLCPRNEVFVRVQNGNTSAKQIGDKLKWFSEQLMPVHFNAYPNNCTLVEALNAWHLARNAHGSDEEDDVSDLESCGMDESMLTMSPFSEHAPDFEATKPVSEVNDVYQAPNKLQLPTSMSRLSMDSSISSGRSSPASTNSEAGNDSEADFARLAENLAIKSNEKGDFDFDHVMDSKESTPVQNRKVPLGPSVLSSTSSTPTTKTPQFKMKQAFTDSGEKMFGPNLMNTLNGYAEKSHGMLGSFFSKTAPKAQALREKTMRPLAEAAANRIEHGQHLIQNKRQHVQQENKDKDPTQAAQLQMKNQQTVRDICDQVLNGQGVGVFQGAKLKRLLEDESLRELVCQKLNLGVSQRYTEDDFLQRVQLTRAQYKGYLKILQACLHGLDHSYNSPHSDGLASLFHVLEIAHTHFWAENETHTPGSGISSLMGTPTSSIHTVFSPAGPSHKSSLTSFLSRNTDPVPVTTTGPVPLQPGVSAPSNKPVQPEKDLFDFNETAPRYDNLIDLDNGVQTNGSNENSSVMTQSTSAVSDSARSETSEPPKSPRRPSEPPSIPPRRPSDAAPSSPRPPPPIPQRPPSGAPPPLPRRPPPLPERPDSARTASASPRRSTSTEPPPVPPPALPTLPEKKSEVSEEKKTEVVPNGHVGGQVPVASETPTITQESPVVAPSANGDIPKPASQKPQANGHVKTEIEKPKSLFVAKPSSPSSSSSSTLEPTRHFLYQDLISASNPLWANMVFWENAFFDMVAKERDIIGMDQEPSEMIDRYSSLNESERKRLELDEDRIIAVLLHNMTAYMVMCGSPSRVLQQKVRRMLGKAHIGLIYSKKINQLLDELPPQPCNLIQLKPLGSRLVQKQSFAVHLGDTAEAPVSFMEVCEDAVIIRACTGQISERWWYERLVNMTYSPRTKVLCIWRRQDDQVHMHKFHTKKCRQLYTCMKTAMERAAQRGKVTIAGRDLGGEFPVHDIETSEGGLLQVRIDGVRLLFADRQDFISLANIKKCNTFGGNMFVLEEFNKQKNELIQRRYISTMARHVAWALHRMFSVRLTLNETLAKALADEEAIDELSGRASPMDRIDAHSDRGYDGDKSVDNSPMISPKRAKASGEVLRERLNMERPTICIQSSIESNEGSATPTASPSFAAKKRKRHRKLSQISFEHTNYPHELRFVTRLTSESDSEENAADFPFFSRPRAPSQPVQTDTEEMNIPRLTSSISMDTALNVWPRKQEDDNEVIEMDDLTPRTEVLPEFG